MPTLQIRQPSTTLAYDSIVNIQIPSLSTPPQAHTSTIAGLNNKNTNDGYDTPLDLSLKSALGSSCEQSILQNTASCSTPTTRSQHEQTDDEFILELLKSSAINGIENSADACCSNSPLKTAANMPQSEDCVGQTPKALEEICSLIETSSKGN